MASLAAISDWHDEADLIVVGSGLAGCAAAIEAHDRDPDADILVIEKAPEHHRGGNSRVAGQSIFIPKERDGLIRYMEELCRSNPLPADYLAHWADEMMELHHWVRARAEEVGAEFSEGAVFAGTKRVLEFPELGAEDAILYTATIKPTPSGLWLAFDANVEKRDRIRRCFETAAAELVQDPDSLEVFGLIVEQDGQQKSIRARRGVILACGGFQANEDMTRNLLGLEKMLPFGTPYNTGDGMRMLMRAGADLWHVRNKMHTVGLGEGIHIPGEPNVFMRNLFMTEFSWLQIAADNRRFENETFRWQRTHHKRKQHGHYLDTLHGAVTPIHMIFDETVRQADQLIFPSFTWSALVADKKWSSDNIAEIEAGWVLKADSIEELAKKMGRDTEQVAATIAHYNMACEAGVDDDHGRDPATLAPIATPPYYAVEIVPGLVCTTGGAKRNIHAQVLDFDGAPIPRLYEAGELGSMFSGLYQNGSMLSECMTSGRAAGAHAIALAELG